jgi:hypothetical protein
MNNFELQERLENSRERLLVALEALPDEALLQANTVGSWSVAELLGHLTAWESELVTALTRLKQGKKPERLLQALSDRDVYNAQRRAESQNRDLDNIFADLQGVRLHLEQWIEEFSQRDLTTNGRYPALGNQPLWRIIARNSFEHEEAHLTAVEQFAQLWSAQEENSSPGHIIRLDDIDLAEGKD